MNEANLDVNRLLDALAAALKKEIEKRGLRDPAMIGIHTGGAWVAQELHERLGLREPLGLLDISFYRDDFSQIGMHPQVKPSSLPFGVDGLDLLLIDDVFYTGRTIRAALNEIFDYGRPARVILGVLIERDGREIPIQPDCVGARVTLVPHQRIKLTGPSPLQLMTRSLETETA